jgi:hypothetical protein
VKQNILLAKARNTTKFFAPFCVIIPKTLSPTSGQPGECASDVRVSCLVQCTCCSFNINFKNKWSLGYHYHQPIWSSHYQFMRNYTSKFQDVSFRKVRNVFSDLPFRRSPFRFHWMQVKGNLTTTLLYQQHSKNKNVRVKRQSLKKFNLRKAYRIEDFYLGNC